jgi:hypothetical protein
MSANWQTDGVIPATKEDIMGMEEMLRALCGVELKWLEQDNT